MKTGPEKGAWEVMTGFGGNTRYGKTLYPEKRTPKSGNARINPIGMMKIKIIKTIVIPPNNLIAKYTGRQHKPNFSRMIEKGKK